MADTAESADAAAKKTADTAAVKVTTATVAAVDPVFTREQLAASKMYIHESDLVMAVLAEGKNYTIAQADAAIQAFLDKEVD